MDSICGMPVMLFTPFRIVSFKKTSYGLLQHTLSRCRVLGHACMCVSIRFRALILLYESNVLHNGLRLKLGFAWTIFFSMDRVFFFWYFFYIFCNFLFFENIFPTFWKRKGDELRKVGHNNLWDLKKVYLLKFWLSDKWK